jgi:hypothetical protein
MVACRHEEARAAFSAVHAPFHFVVSIFFEPDNKTLVFTLPIIEQVLPYKRISHTKISINLALG